MDGHPDSPLPTLCALVCGWTVFVVSQNQFSFFYPFFKPLKIAFNFRLSPTLRKVTDLIFKNCEIRKTSLPSRSPVPRLRFYAPFIAGARRKSPGELPASGFNPYIARGGESSGTGLPFPKISTPPPPPSKTLRI